ncbi:MAG TPA: hypothetical protein VKA65_09980, partial [Acidimicrobiales bacterium]|nr:hypothetical protein [Acidimicrobiales bacterium]
MATAVPGTSAPPGQAADEPHARGLPGEPDAPDLSGRPPDRRRLTEAGRARLLVLLAVVAAALVRAPVPEAALPFVHHPDEPPNIVRVENMVAEGTLHPGNFIYPAVMYDVSAAFLTATDHEVIATQTPGNSKAVRPNLVVGLRWVVGLLPGLVTVVAAGALGWMGSRRWWVAGGAAAVLALSPLDVRFGPLVTPDAIAGAATGLAVVGALWVRARLSTRSGTPVRRTSSSAGTRARSAACDPSRGTRMLVNGVSTVAPPVAVSAGVFSARALQLTTTAVTMPYMPVSRSTWSRMWQCHTQVPGL